MAKLFEMSHSHNRNNEILQRRTCAENVSAFVTARGEVVVVTIGAVESIVVGGKWLVDQRSLTIGTLEALLVPVHLLIRQVLREVKNRRQRIKY